MATIHKSTVRPAENGLYEAEIGGHKFMMDSQSGDLSQAPTPKPFMLAALAGCTAIDVTALLEKMRVSYSDFSVETIAELSDEHPKYYTKTEIIYNIKLQPEDQSKMEKAVALSVEKYCGVHKMFEGFSKVKHRIVYL
jgi:putative redox protein